MLKILLILSLFLFNFLTNGVCAITEGTNAGFVTSTPSGDPAGTSGLFDGYALGVKHTSPSGNNKIIEFGWYCSQFDAESYYEIGIYSHDADNNRPNLLLYGTSPTSVTGKNAWQSVSGISYNIDASTVYWIAVQTDKLGSGDIDIDYEVNASFKEDYIGTPASPLTELPDSWGSSGGTYGRIFALYAKYEVSTARRVMIVQ